MNPMAERRRGGARIAFPGVLVAAVALLMAFSAALPVAAESPRRCTCRYAGQSFAQGACVCIMTPRGARRACCEKVLNNSSWSFKPGLCPLAAVPAPPRGGAEAIASPVPEVAETPPAL